MKALVYHGREDVRIEEVPQPQIQEPTDAIIKVTLTAICGSDLHMYDGLVPDMHKGDILGHEFMGEVIATGSKVKKIKKGDRIVVAFPISCGECDYCKHDLWSLCQRTNPDHKKVETMYGYSGSGIYGYSHLYGGYAGGQAEYVRVINADVNSLKVPDSISDEQALFLSDIFPTGFMAADNCAITDSIHKTVAVFGCGPVGQFAIASAFMLGAKKVIAIDRFPERLALAKKQGAEIINYEKNTDLVAKIKQLTDNVGPDACIDAVGMEATGTGIGDAYTKVKQTVKLQMDRPTALYACIQTCGPGGVVSIAGVYTAFVDKFPIGAAFGKGLRFAMGQCHVQKYMSQLLKKIEQKDIDPSFIITHSLPLEKAPEAYKMFRDKENKCIKVVLKP